MVVQRERRTPTSGRPSCGVAVFVATTALLVLCRSVTAFVVDLSTSTWSRPYRVQVVAPCIFTKMTFKNQNQSDLSFCRYCYQRHHHRHHQLYRCGLYSLSWHGLPKLSRLSFTVQWPFSASPRKLWKRVQRQISRRIPGFQKEKQQVEDKEDPTDDSVTSKTTKSLRSERHVLDDEAEAANSNNKLPKGPRWAIAAPHVDLSGTWKPIITPAFRQEYDRYLKNCGEGIWFRKTLLAAIGFGGTREEYKQLDQGRSLIITGITPVTQWKRTLVASGTTKSSSHEGNENKDDDYQPVYTSFCDPDGDMVQVEAWWEDQGTVHTSILRNKPRVLGGMFESKRYLDPNSNGHILICQSTFYPSETHGNYTAASSHKFHKDQVTWEFERLD